MLKQTIVLGALTAIVSCASTDTSKSSAVVAKKTQKDKAHDPKKAEDAKKRSTDNNHVLQSMTNSYRILQFTDLHFGEDPDADKLTHDHVFGQVSHLKPNLVVITGDIVSGGFLGSHNHWGSSFDHYYNQLCSWFEINQLPFAWVPGPGDYEAFGLDAHDFNIKSLTDNCKWDMSSYNSFKWESKGLHHPFTYDLKVPNASGDDVALRVFMFSSGRFDCMGMGGMDCIRRDAVEWFREESEAIPADNMYRQNGIAFMHTALQEHMFMADTQPVHGQKRDYSACQAINTGLFSEMVQQGTVQAVFAGGDHSTDLWGDYNGIILGYGRKSGFGSYGPKFQLRGVRVIDINLDSEGNMELKTFIQQEDGSVDNQAELTPPSKYSWLKKGHCMGAEEFADLTQGILNLDLATTSWDWQREVQGWGF